MTFDNIYEFCANNRVESTMAPNGVYNCYINYRDGDRPWGSGKNVLDAIENGVVTFLRHHANRGFQQPQHKMLPASGVPALPPDQLAHFLSYESFIFWYWFAVKYNKTAVIDQYEQQAQQKHPSLVNTIRFLVEKAEATIKDINTKLYEKIPAINNVWIQAIVYYESFIAEKYENNKIIMDMIEKNVPEDREAFHRIQKQIGKVDEEIQTLP
jgi:hypothetical protein